VNDLERDLRAVFHDDALRVPTPATAPEGLRRSARRRQAVFAGAIGLAGLAVVAGIVMGATSLVSTQSGPEPAVQGPKTTGTMNGITITYPETWHLIDPDTAGLNGSPTMGESPLPRIVLALAPSERTETFGCPGRANPDDASPLLMTVQEEPPTLGDLTKSWPVELQPMNVDASESACFPGWEFMRARWIAAGRTFEARIGFAPDVSDEEHDAMVAAFASMNFEPTDAAAASVVLAQGSAGGEHWQLSASRAKGGLSIELTGESTGSGLGGVGDASAFTEIQASDLVFGTGSQAERVIFGVVPEGVVRVEASTGGGSPVSADVLDVPDDLDPNLNAFVLVLDDPDGKVQLSGVDASGHVVATGSVGHVQASTSPSTSAALEDGRHFGYVRSVDPNAGTIEFDLAYFLSGKEANDAYHAAGGTGPVPNDHFVVNDNPMLRTLTLSPDLRLRLLDWNHCCETFFDGDLSLFAQAIEQQDDVTDGDLIYRGKSSWWVTVKDGVVTQIEEQYSP
jgi:hypothetical protein